MLKQKLTEIPQSIWNEQQLVEYQRSASEEYDSSQISSSYEGQSEQRTRHDEVKEMTTTLLRPGEVLQGTIYRLRSKLTGWEWNRYLDRVGVEACPRFPRIELTRSDVTRWKMASRLVESLSRERSEEEERIQEWIQEWVRNMRCRRCQDWPEVELIFHLPIALGFSGAALIYGGLHALAWSTHFETFTEQLLWRMSACGVMGGVLVCFVILTLGDYRQRPKFLVNWNKVFSFMERLYVVFIYLILLTYILARAYLVVESFISLSHLPAGAYDLPRWSTYFPHFS